MNTKAKVAGSILAVSLGWSSAGYAGCNAVQVSGIWETAFSDGNSCRIKLKNNGSIDTSKSVCFDPDRGTTDIESGTIKPKGDCFANGEMVINGATIELPVQFSHDRSVAAGRFLFTDDGTKGSVMMVRVN